DRGLSRFSRDNFPTCFKRGREKLDCTLRASVQPCVVEGPLGFFGHAAPGWEVGRPKKPSVPGPGLQSATAKTAATCVTFALATRRVNGPLVRSGRHPPLKKCCAMPITVACRCGRELKAREEYAGTRAECPYCGT